MKADRLVVATAISWAGLWIHEVHRVPALLGFTPDGDIFMLCIAAGLAYWWHRTHATSAAAWLLVYGAINLVGGTLTVLPLEWMPFKPEQTWSHYLAHVVYAVSQVPLMVLAARQVFGRISTPAR
jgi:hypothetical protein